ncbi:MAG: DNA-directed DNA polymerase I [Promethearchaeota archaeon]
MPTSKKSKKNKSENEKQKSLFAYIGESKKEAHKKPQLSKDQKSKAVAKKIKPKEPEKTQELEKKGEEVQKVKDLLKKEYFKLGDLNFGLKEGEIHLESIQRESHTSKYIRYLKKANKIVKNMRRGLLLDINYDGGENKAYCKFYDLDEHDIKIWIDTTNHQPYCLSKVPKKDLEQLEDLMTYEGFDRIEEIKRIDLLRDIEITMSKIYGKTPINIGGAGRNIKNILNEHGIKAWEADIRYHLNYIFDRQLIPGLIYSIKNGVIHQISSKEIDESSKDLAEKLRSIFKNESPEIQEFAEKNLDIFLTPIPEVKRLAMDIETELGIDERHVPNPREAKQKIISVSFVDNDGLKMVYILERENFTFEKIHEDFPPDAKLYFFKSEKDLIIETFRMLWKYPIVITFNGDNFDLNYLFHRANKLKIDKDLNPIQVKRGFGILSQAECDLRKGIHVDLFNFFFNRSISGYAFGGAYSSNSLNAISEALLGKEKYQHEEEIFEMEYDVLSWYNLKDSILTLELTQFNNSLVWNLIILLCRITKLPIHEMLRRQISTWIQNIFYFEHRRKRFLIPRRSEITELKEGGFSKAQIEGKGFQGAYVVPPVPGIHFDVVVMDFASLYPSIIKEYNLSYETVLCPHEDCKDNVIEGIPYHVCTHKMGIFAYVVGFLRDIRVNFFKPMSGDKSLTQKQRSYYKTIQQALKVFINSAYGTFGSSNFPLFCLPVAESITAKGRYSIKETIKKANEIGVKVLYGDTDSVFLLNPSYEQMREISNWSKEKLKLDLEEEKVFQFLALSERKKNYIGIYKDSKLVDIKGLLAKKKNTPDFIKKIFSQIIEILKDVKDEEKFAQSRKKIIDIVRENLKKIGKPGAFPLEDYAINISLQKSLEKYDKTIPQHVRVALELQNVTGKKLQKGDVVSFIKSKGSLGAKALELAKIEDIDVKKYKELLRSALEQLLDALGITFDEIRGIKTMDSFFK